MRLESVYSGIVLFCAMILVAAALMPPVSYWLLISALALCIVAFGEAPK